MDTKLEELRNKIDAIDSQILELLKNRSGLVLEVGKHKGDNGGNNLIRSGREAKMLRDLVAKGAGHFPKPAIRSMWRSIISASLSIECGLKIAIPKGLDFERHKTIIEYFGSFSSYKQCENDAEIFSSIDKQTVGVFTLDTGFWLELAEEKHKNLKIFAKLGDGIYAVAKLQPEESGDDVTLAITHAQTHKGHKLAEHGKVKLIEVKGFHLSIDDAVVVGSCGC